MENVGKFSSKNKNKKEQKQPPEVFCKKKVFLKISWTPMLKCDFSKVGKQLYLNYTLIWVLGLQLY